MSIVTEHVRCGPREGVFVYATGCLTCEIYRAAWTTTEALLKKKSKQATHRRRSQWETCQLVTMAMTRISFRDVHYSCSCGSPWFEDASPRDFGLRTVNISSIQDLSKSRSPLCPVSFYHV